MSPSAIDYNIRIAYPTDPSRDRTSDVQQEASIDETAFRISLLQIFQRVTSATPTSGILNEDPLLDKIENVTMGRIL